MFGLRNIAAEFENTATDFRKYCRRIYKKIELQNPGGCVNWKCET